MQKKGRVLSLGVGLFEKRCKTRHLVLADYLDKFDAA